jgi:hypothetical protein
LRDHSRRHLTLIGRSHAYLEGPGYIVWREPRSLGAAGLVRSNSRGSAAVGVRAAGAGIRQREYDDRTGYWTIVLVIHLNNAFARHALSDIVDGAVALNHNDSQLWRRCRLRETDLRTLGDHQDRREEKAEYLLKTF